MTIADQITRLNNAKAAIKQSIENKGVTVGEDVKLDKYADYIDNIEIGSGGSDSEYVNPDFYEFRTANGTNYKGLFSYYNNYKALTIDLSNFDTSQVTDMSNMFHFSVSLKSVDLSSFDTSNVTDMSEMFYYCGSLTSLDLSSFDTSNVTDMSEMFRACSYLTSLDVSSFNTSNVTNMNGMFYSCNKLTSLDLSHFDTSKVTNIGYMFNDCSALTSLDVSSWDTSKVTSLSNIFYGCKLLASLDLSNWDVSKVTSFSSVFYNCTALTDLQAPKNISAALDVSRCPNLTHDSLMSIINNLATVSSSKKLTLGATNLAKLSDDEIAIATNKGWTVK